MKKKQKELLIWVMIGSLVLMVTGVAGAWYFFAESPTAYSEVVSLEDVVLTFGVWSDNISLDTTLTAQEQNISIVVSNTNSDIENLNFTAIESKTGTNPLCTDGIQTDCDFSYFQGETEIFSGQTINLSSGDTEFTTSLSCIFLSCPMKANLTLKLEQT